MEFWVGCFDANGQNFGDEMPGDPRRSLITSCRNIILVNFSKEEFFNTHR
jgi:hypothetical protein